MQEEDVELVMQHVLGILEHFERKQKVNSHAPILWTHAMVDAAKPFLFENAETFCKELQNFMLSGLNVKAYDLLVEEALRAHTLEVVNHGVLEKVIDAMWKAFDVLLILVLLSPLTF